MAEEQTPLTQALADELRSFAEPLLDAGASETAAIALLVGLGWRPQAVAGLLAAVQNAAGEVETALAGLDHAVEATDSTAADAVARVVADDRAQRGFLHDLHYL